MALRRFALAALFLIAAAAIPALAQGPSPKRINFSINTPFELKKSNITHLFALYRDDLMHSPVAMIRTMRVDNTTRWPDKTKLFLETDESSSQSYPMLEGWNIPGDHGWEVVSVTTNRGALSISRYQARSMARSR